MRTFQHDGRTLRERKISVKLIVTATIVFESVSRRVLFSHCADSNCSQLYFKCFYMSVVKLLGRNARVTPLVLGMSMGRTDPLPSGDRTPLIP